MKREPPGAVERGLARWRARRGDPGIRGIAL